MKLTAREDVADGWLDYLDQLDNERTAEDVRYWVQQVDEPPCCIDCGYWDMCRVELLTAVRERAQFEAGGWYKRISYRW